MNPAAFTELYTRHGTRLVSSMTRVMRNQQDGEDVATTALARAYAHYSDFRGKASLYSWVYAIAMNEARNTFHRRKSAAFEPLENHVDRFVLREQAQDRSERNSLCGQLKKALKQVPLKYRVVLLRHFVEGHPMKQIASDLGIPVGTVLSRMFKAKSLLRHAWGATR